VITATTYGPQLSSRRIRKATDRSYLKDGRTISGHADFGKGSLANPMSYEEVAEKFRGCAEAAHWPATQASAIIDAVRRLETLADVRELTALCAND
jgi:hypothetical protein